MLKISNYLINKNNILYIKQTMIGITITFVNNEQLIIKNATLEDIQEISDKN